MKSVCLIPARMASTRFPGKMLAKIDGRSVISRTYNSVAEAKIFDAVYVVTDSQEIKKEIEGIGGQVFISHKPYESGSDRIAEAAQALDFDIIVNVQGDEPFIQKEPLSALISLLDDDKVECASLMQEIASEEDVLNPNNVKVVTDNYGFALYFSRSPIPFDRDGIGKAKYYKHIGVYGFRKDTLLRFTTLPQSELEQSEKLEQLRMLQDGIKIKMAITQSIGVEIDAPEDIKKAEFFIKQHSK